MEDFNCPKCNSLFHGIADKWNGQKIRCSHCGCSFVAGEVPEAEHERIVRHSFIGIFVQSTLVTGLFLIPWAISKGIEPRPFHGFMWLIASAVTAYLTVTRNPIRFSQDGMCTINPVVGRFFSVEWNEISNIKTRNLLILQIIILQIKLENGAMRRDWLGYYSFSPRKLFEEMETCSSGLIRNGQVQKQMIETLSATSQPAASGRPAAANFHRKSIGFSKRAFGIFTVVSVLLGLFTFRYQMISGFELFALKSESPMHFAVTGIMAAFLFLLTVRQKQVRFLFRGYAASILISGLHKLPFWGAGLKWVLFFISSVAHYAILAIMVFTWVKWDSFEQD